jgi:hypothetical protein
MICDKNEIKVLCPKVRISNDNVKEAIVWPFFEPLKYEITIEL